MKRESKRESDFERACDIFGIRWEIAHAIEDELRRLWVESDYVGGWLEALNLRGGESYKAFLAGRMMERYDSGVGALKALHDNERR